jgi:ATP-binding cassette, subfamily B, bacterial PglK
MQQKPKIIIKHLWKNLSSRRRRQFILLLILTLVGSFAEILSLAAVIPFISILSDPSVVFKYDVFGDILFSFTIYTGLSPKILLTACFIFAVLTAGSLRLLLLWISIRLGNAIGTDLSVEVFRKTLYQDYSVHLNRNSSEIVSAIIQKVTITTSVMVAIVGIITTTLLFIAVLGTIFFVQPVIATLTVCIFGLAYGLVAIINQKTLKDNSYIIAYEINESMRALQEGLGSIREVLLNNTQNIYCDIYSKSIFKLKLAEGRVSFINQAPRYVIESLGVTLIAIFVYYLSSRSGGFMQVFPGLALLALGAQRLLPLMQQLFSNWATVVSSRAGLIEILALLNQPLSMEAKKLKLKKISFKESIVFKEITFKYDSSSSFALKDINLNIDKADLVGFVGKTGSGKSTLVDLLMGLLHPIGGKLLVDGIPITYENRKAWQQLIAHVPQNIFLIDATIYENIAFGVSYDEIDFEKVRDVAKRAHISEFIEAKSKGYDSIIGEQGMLISGGQRQRIGIARALYTNASLLVFDEGTSALDLETEVNVMKAIEDLSKDLTIIIIAHRLNTLKNCSKIYVFDDGSIKKAVNYEGIKKF